MFYKIDLTCRPMSRNNELYNTLDKAYQNIPCQAEDCENCYNAIVCDTLLSLRNNVKKAILNGGKQ